MSSSLKDQLISAGLLSKEQARSSSRKKRPKKSPNKSGRKRELDPEAQERQALVAAHEARERERNRELNQQREQARKAQEQAERIRQILSTRALPKVGLNEETSRYNFQLDKRIHGLHVTAAQRKMLVDGKAGIVHFDGQYHLLPMEHAERLKALSPKRVWVAAEAEQPPKSDDDPYAGYEVPDDLIW